MPYSEDLAERVRAGMSHLDGLTERPVMSGLGFFIDDRMAIAVLDDRLCLWVGDAENGAALTNTAARPFEFAGRAVEGWVCIPEESLDEASLAGWVARGVANLGLSV
jgi:hypothetical protein